MPAGFLFMEASMNINKSFAYIFEDKQWLTKLGIGALISMVPILNFAWLGYMIGIIRNVINNEVEPLPDWSEMGKRFTDGLVFSLAGLVYSLPMLLVVCLPLGFIAIPAMISSGGNMQDVADALAATGGVLFMCLMCLFVVYALALSVLYPAIQVHFARQGTFASCFKLREIFSLVSRNSGPFFTAWLVSIGASLVVSFAAGILGALIGWIPCLGQLVVLVVSLGAMVIFMAVYAHLFGQFGAMAYSQDAEITPAKT